VPWSKLSDKAFLIKLHGKDRMKKNIDLGQIGKIYFNRLTDFQPNKRVEFVHEIEQIRPVGRRRRAPFSQFLLFFSFSRPSSCSSHSN
jgi:hypothetical protein